MKDRKAEALADGEEWIEPEERLRLEEEEANRVADEARKAELKAGLKYFLLLPRSKQL